MQDQMGRIPIPSERLQQWKATALQLARVVVVLLAIESKAEDQHGQTNIRIGMINGKKGRRWLSLNKSPLTLEINNHRLPLEEVLFFEHDMLAIDRGHIDQKTTVNIEGLETGSAKWRSQTARNAANARHDKLGGSRDKQQQIRDI